MTDTGLLDAELWRDYLADAVADHARLRPPAGRGLGRRGRRPATGALDVANLDLTSLGSPANTTLRVTWTKGTETGDAGEVAGRRRRRARSRSTCRPAPPGAR